MIRCTKCGKDLGGGDRSGQLANISGSIMGDECTESYFFCQNCSVYTVEVFWDVFTGEEEVHIRGPLSKENGDEKIRLIGECSTPWDKKCRCPAHRAYFGDSLD
jgi:hypothetical protein